MLAMSARILARLPNRFGTSILDGLERTDLFRSSRARGHRAALRRLFPGDASWDPRLSRQAVWRHAQWVYDSLSGFGGRKFRIEWEDPTELGKVVGQGSPVLIVTAHVGNWLVVAEACTRRLGPVETVAGVQLRAAWDESIRRFLEERGVTVHRPDGAYRQFRRRLKAGGTVVLHLDGTPSPSPPDQAGSTLSWNRTEREGLAPSPLTAPLGVRAAARLSSATKARVFGVVSRRTGPDRYTLYVEDLQNATETGLTSYLRRQVSANPAEWLIFRAEHLGGGVAP